MYYEASYHVHARMTLLSGKRVFLVEDEFLLARQMSRALTQEGAVIIGCVATVAAALDELSRLAQIDFAILDINLAGERVYPVAAELARREVRFVFVSGYDLDDRDPQFAGAPQLSKPITMAALSRALKTALGTTPAKLH